MNKPVTPKQLDLVEKVLEAPRGEVLLATAPHIDDGPEFEDFDWFTDASVVLKGQPATAVYINRKGHLVVRQERSWAQEDDPYVTIAPENAVLFMEALAKRAREG